MNKKQSTPAKKKAQEYRVMARLTMEGPGSMTPRMRNDIMSWLYNVSVDLTSGGDDLTNGRYTARYSVPVKPVVAAKSRSRTASA